MYSTFAVVAMGTFSLAALDPPVGTYATKHATYTVDALDSSSTKLHAHWPVVASGGGGDAGGSSTTTTTTATKFPLVSYLHGLAGGGIDIISYGKLFDAIAAFGFIVVAPASCSGGCKHVGGRPLARHD